MHSLFPRVDALGQSFQISACELSNLICQSPFRNPFTTATLSWYTQSDSSAYFYFHLLSTLPALQCYTIHKFVIHAVSSYQYKLYTTNTSWRQEVSNGQTSGHQERKCHADHFINDEFRGVCEARSREGSAAIYRLLWLCIAALNVARVRPDFVTVV